MLSLVYIRMQAADGSDLQQCGGLSQKMHPTGIPLVAVCICHLRHDVFLRFCLVVAGMTKACSAFLFAVIRYKIKRVFELAMFSKLVQ